MFTLNRIFLITIILLVAACSDNQETSGDHVWKEQTDTIDKAKEVEAMMMKSVEDQKIKIEDQTQ